MKFIKRQKLAFVLAASLWLPGALSQARENNREIGVINIQKIILTVEDGKKAREQLEKEIREKETDFLKQKEELDKLNKDWQSKSALLSEEARFKKQQEFQTKFLDLRNAEMEFQKEINQKQQKVTGEIAGKAAAFAKNLAEKKNLDVVFEANSAGLVWIAQPVDLTDEVIALYGKDRETRVSRK
ncbi:MAG: OmpH family outer membrane protein [Deltaproteobacteria bacterium]|nr:OmpH family outer membrane protein [Deltaproteobacteria bacterium]